MRGGKSCILADCLRSAGKGPHPPLSLCISIRGLYQPCFVFLMPSEDAIRKLKSISISFMMLWVDYPAGKDIGVSPVIF